jgi:hypothetical protein
MLRKALYISTVVLACGGSYGRDESPGNADAATTEPAVTDGGPVNDGEAADAADAQPDSRAVPVPITCDGLCSCPAGADCNLKCTLPRCSVDCGKAKSCYLDCSTAITCELFCGSASPCTCTKCSKI